MTEDYRSEIARFYWIAAYGTEWFSIFCMILYYEHIAIAKMVYQAAMNAKKCKSVAIRRIERKKATEIIIKQTER